MIVFRRFFCTALEKQLFIDNSHHVKALKCTSSRSVHLNYCNRSSKKGLPEEWGSKSHKGKRKVKMQMSSVPLSSTDEAVIQPLRDSVKEQGDYVRMLKEETANEAKIKDAVKELKIKKKNLEEMVKKLSPFHSFDKARMDDLIKRRFFFGTSFDIYGGISGQCDFGPIGCDLLENIISEWQRHFVVQDRMLKINTSCITPEVVFKASGHTARFTDSITKDVNTGICYRLDHIIKSKLEDLLSDGKLPENERDDVKSILQSLDTYSLEQLDELVTRFNIKSEAGNDLTNGTAYNLMFPLNIGPQGLVKGYLRPETSQGIFVNFKNLLSYNQGRLPFACAQIGNAYRNEISPDSGLLRLREFTMAEIIHFCHPDDKSHYKFNQVMDEELLLYSDVDQSTGKSPCYMTVGQAVDKRIISNETLGYYMAKIQKFLLNIGIDKKRLRFRQHMSNEMAHYACDCWDAECLTSYGWIECVGCADRSAYDLTQHSTASGKILAIEEPSDEPIILETPELVMDKTAIRRKYLNETTAIIETLSKLKKQDIMHLEEQLNTHGEYILDNKYVITKKMVTQIKKTTNIKKTIPAVIEPSFGIGRILYALLENTFSIRNDDSKRTYFALPPCIAPIKVSVFPLSDREEFMPIVNDLVEEFANNNIKVRLEDSAGSIGKRYTKSDELSVPYGITVDFDTLNKTPHTVTIRERDSKQQIRINLEDATNILSNLISKKVTWQMLVASQQKFISQETKQLHVNN